ncbi:MAG: class I SAM-dependent methyltransferase [Candidatus Paceibacterota bacterium]|jgi:SAM-dependent methyltransferase
MEDFYKRLECHSCGNKGLIKVLDLGATPLANAFLSSEALGEPELIVPLAINFCPECSLVQLTHVVKGDVLFSDDYHYATSASRPLVEHFKGLAQEIAKHYVKSPHDLVIEIGSNDGTLLSYLTKSCNVLGIDPARNMAAIALTKGVPTVTEFLDMPLAERLRKEKGGAKVVVANNVMAHIDGIKDVFAAVKELLADDGRFIFEVHWVGNLVTEGGFDQIYHEHLFYYSLHSLRHMLGSLGMVINDVKLVPMHGESLRVYAGRSGESSQAVRDLLKREEEMGLAKAETYLAFSKKVFLNKEKLMKFLKDMKKSGKKIVGYGAPGKGNTLLNYYGIGPDILDFITDTTPQKQGTYTPGMHIPVVHPDRLKSEQPDYILLLSWNYADAILAKEKALRDQGVKFIVPVPEMKIV